MGVVEMGPEFRRADKAAWDAVTKALRSDVYGAHPEMSLEQVSGLLTSGADDAHAVSLDTLQAVLIGQRKLPLHKLGRLKQIIEAATGRTARATITEIARQCGGIFVALADLPCAAIGSLANLVRESNGIEEAAIDAEMDGNITADEYERIRSEAYEAIAAQLAYVERAKSRVRRSAARV